MWNWLLVYTSCWAPGRILSAKSFQLAEPNTQGGSLNEKNVWLNKETFMCWFIAGCSSVRGRPSAITLPRSEPVIEGRATLWINMDLIHPYRLTGTNTSASGRCWHRCGFVLTALLRVIRLSFYGTVEPHGKAALCSMNGILHYGFCRAVTQIVCSKCSSA